MQQMLDSACPVCAQPAQITHFEESDSIHCPRCQTYRADLIAVSALRNPQISPKQRAVISGWICENTPVKIGPEDIPRLVALRPPTLAARVERLMRALVRYTEFPSEPATLPMPSKPFLTAVASAQNESELDFYIRHLIDRGYIYERLGVPAPFVTPVTSAGFEYVESLERVGRDSAIGFCAMWFNAEVTPVWTEAIEPAITEAGYEPKRIDNVEHNNRIDEEIIAWIRRSRFLVADLTEHRAGVYFEAGFAMGLGLPVVWMVRADQADKTHFDNRQYNHIRWTRDNLGEAKQRLLNRIVATIGEGPTVRGAPSPSAGTNR
jgi:hypothetical protein